MTQETPINPQPPQIPLRENKILSGLNNVSLAAQSNGSNPPSIGVFGPKTVPTSFDFGDALRPDYVLKCSYGNDSIALIQFCFEYWQKHPLDAGVKVVCLYNDTGWAKAGIKECPAKNPGAALWRPACLARTCWRSVAREHTTGWCAPSKTPDGKSETNSAGYSVKDSRKV
jgi:hypothetical protein